MEKQHLTYFKIENFKRFDSFEMENLGQFNLIVGDNNVGKTSVLEALTFDENISKLCYNFFSNFMNRRFYNPVHNDNAKDAAKNINYWNVIFKDTNIPIIIKIKAGESTQLKVELKSNDQLNDTEKEYLQKKFIGNAPKIWLKLSVENSDRNAYNFVGASAGDSLGKSDFKELHNPFLSANSSYGPDIVDFFYLHFNANKDARHELEENLRTLIPNIEEIRTHKFFNSQEALSVNLTGSNSIHPISQFGDGTVKLVRLLIELIIEKDHRFMVDEIGDGIHFTRLASYWKMVIRLCDKYNVQLFATTHSLECQQAFIEALEDPEMQQYQKNARNISLIENKQGEVKAITFDFEQFEYALNIGFNTRGGKA